MKRDAVSDALRGFAIIVVVFGHVYGWLDVMSISFEGDKVVPAFVFTFHMPLFFMMSGYVHGLKEHFQSGEQYKYYFKKNVISIYIPCLFFSYLQAFLNLLMSFYLEGVNVPSVYDFLLIPFSGFLNYWFLCELFLVKSVHLLLERYVKSEYIHMLFWLIVFIVIKPFTFSEILPEFVIFFTYGLYFHIGFVMRRYNILSERLSYGIILLLIGTACFIVNYIYGNKNVILQTGTALCLSLACFMIFYALRITNSFLVMCGLYSMVIYCIHNYGAVIFRLSYKLLNLQMFNLHASLLFLMCFAFALFIPLMTVWLYKNVKCLRWVEYIFYPGKYKRNPLP